MKKKHVPHILNSYVIVSVLQPLYSASLQAIYLTTYLTCIPPFCFTFYLTFHMAFYSGILSGIYSGPGAPHCILSSRHGSSPGAPANSTCDLEIGPSPPHHLALAICRSGPGAPHGILSSRYGTQQVKPIVAKAAREGHQQQSRESESRKIDR